MIINLNYELEEKDYDYLSYYINFLKVINNKINSENIKYIFHIKYNIFPLLDQILVLLNNDDIMIRNSARNVFLSLIKLNYSPLIDYICDIPRVAIFIILMRKIKSNILLMINLKNNDKNLYIEKTKELKEKIIEDLLFMQDILSINISKINYIILNCFFSIVILFLFSKIVSFSANKKNPNKRLEVSKSINVLRTIFKFTKNENIKNIICFLIFSKKVYFKINEYLMDKNQGEIKDNKIENAKLLNLIYFNFNYCYSKINFEEYIIWNYSQNFLQSIRNIVKHSGIDEKLIYNEIKEISNLIQSKDEKDDTSLCIQLLNTKLINQNNNFLQRMYNFHYFIAKHTGIDCGIYHEENNTSFLSILYNNFLYIQNNIIINNDNYYQNNLLRKEILNYFENEVNCVVGSNKNAIFNLILFLIEIIYDKNIGIKEIINISKNNEKTNIAKPKNILINNEILNLLRDNHNNYLIPTVLLKPIINNEFLIINKEKILYTDINMDNNFFGKINLNINSISEQSEIIINIINFIFYPKIDLNNNDILLCFKLIESIFNESYFKNIQLMKYMKSLYLKTLLRIKEILFKNNYDLKNGIFKFSYSYFEKAFFLNKKSLNEIIAAYYSDLKIANFEIIDNSYNLREKEDLKNCFQKYVSLHDLLKINSTLFKNIEYPLKLIKDTNFVQGGKVNLDKYNLTTINIKLYIINSENKNNYNSNLEYLTMFVFNNYLFFALSPENISKYDINAIDGENLYLIKYMFCLRYINLIKDIELNTLLFIFDENEYKHNIHVIFENLSIFNKAKDILVNGINNSIILEYSSISSFINNQIIELNKDIEKIII